ncbi:MAG: hypothetical protein LAP21_05945 [Acidobacteriia bacterium]|nr:hypothetical protein [Terriglobia bacterium]
MNNLTKAEEKSFRKSLAAAIQRRDELTFKRQQIEKEEMQQHKLIAAISEVLGEGRVDNIGLTEATELVVGVSDNPLTAMEIRDELRGMGYGIDHFSNPLASLHQVLKRLQAKGKIEPISSDGGKTKFKSTGVNENANVQMLKAFREGNRDETVTAKPAASRRTRELKK